MKTHRPVSPLERFGLSVAIGIATGCVYLLARAAYAADSTTPRSDQVRDWCRSYLADEDDAGDAGVADGGAP